MNKTDVTNFFKGIQNGISKHSPEILTGLGIAGMITTTVLAVKATPKALQLVEEKKDEEHKDELTVVETVKTAWKPYVPAAVTGAVSVGCLIGAQSVNAKRNAALATAYQLSTTALADYKEQLIETIGEKKEKVVRDKIAQKQVDEHPPKATSVYDTGNGGTLVYDPQFDKYFRCHINSIDAAVNKLNQRMSTGQSECISLSEFYNELGVKPPAIGEDLGWNIGRDGFIEIDHSSAIVTDTGEPCVVLRYDVAPKYDYFKINAR